MKVKPTYYLREIEAVYKKTDRECLAIRITQAEDVAKWFSDLQDKTREHFIVLFLNRAKHVICFSEFTGGFSYCGADPKVIFQHALLSGASALIVLHNHPSGTAEPSNDDIKITKTLRDAGKMLDITVLDHVLIAGPKFYSFQEHHLF